MQGIYPLFGAARERTDSFLSHSTAQSHTGAATSLKTEQGISWGISGNETGIQAKLLDGLVRSSILYSFRLVPESQALIVYLQAAYGFVDMEMFYKICAEVCRTAPKHP